MPTTQPKLTIPYLKGLMDKLLEDVKKLKQRRRSQERLKEIADKEIQRIDETIAKITGDVNLATGRETVTTPPPAKTPPVDGRRKKSKKKPAGGKSRSHRRTYDRPEELPSGTFSEAAWRVMCTKPPEHVWTRDELAQAILDQHLYPRLDSKKRVMDSLGTYLSVELKDLVIKPERGKYKRRL